MSGDGNAETSRRANEIAANLALVVERIDAAARNAGRSGRDITVIAITKTWPAADVRSLVGLGVSSIGENKAQEMAAKAQECSDLPVEWHFVGQLQRNKARLVAERAHTVHSIDRPQLVSALNRHVEELQREPLTCLIQVNLDPMPEAGRGGVSPDLAPDLADLVALSPGLSLGGVMGVASQLQEATRSFDLLVATAQEVTGRHPSAKIISAGMSGDYATAIEAGATHVRLGAALLGQRPNVR